MEDAPPSDDERRIQDIGSMVDAHSPESPEYLMRLGTGHWSTKPFLTACEMKLFSLVERGTDTVDGIANALSLPRRGTRFLMDGMAALGLFAKEGESYRTTPLSSTFLVEGKEEYMADLFIAIDRMFYDSFTDFEAALRQDSPVWSVDREGRHVPLTGEESDLFTRGMHGLSVWTSGAFARSYSLADRQHLLDLGGGSGAMSIGAVRHNPGLKATVLDRPRVCAMARSLISQAGLSLRIDTVEADLFTDAYPVGPDVHLYSNILHNYKGDECRYLLKKSYESLPPSGAVVIADFVLDKSRTSPSFATVFNFLALVAMSEGETHTFGEYEAWLQGAGFVDVRCTELTGSTTLVFAAKPGG